VLERAYEGLVAKDEAARDGADWKTTGNDWPLRALRRLRLEQGPMVGGRRKAAETMRRTRERLWRLSEDF
jgi:hypothetical protein